MKKIFLLIIVVLAFLWIMPTGCAVIVPPTGGPKDSLPPVFLGSTPADSSTHFNAKEVVLNFNEYVDLDNAFNNLIVSPVSRRAPTVERHLRQVTIKIKDSLEPNTTYAYDFGKTIKDVNEGNVLKNFTYVFSTGDHIDTNTVSGTVRLAETGGVDTTLLVVLYTNFSDTAIYKTQPKYYTKILDSTGRFAFHFLPEKEFKVFAVENSYMKDYNDSTALFAFLDTTINTANDSLCHGLRLNAFHAFPKTPPKKNEISASQKQKEKEKEAKKPLTVSTNIQQGKQGLLIPLELTYSKPLKQFDSSLVLLTDTSGNRVQDYRIMHDSADTTNTRFILKTAWREDSSYRLVIPEEAAKDSFDIALTKADTILFQAKSSRDYAIVRLKFTDMDTALHPVLQIFSADNKPVDSIRIPESAQIYIPMIEPGKYHFKILYDLNGDMKWTPGNYEKRLQPEIVIDLKKEFSFVADYENEWDDIPLKPREVPKYNPLNL